MQKQQIALVGCKILNAMLAYRKHNRYFASYKEACSSIEEHTNILRQDELRFILQQPDKINTIPLIALRNFQNNIINLAAKCLLTVAECQGEHLFYDDVFDTYFEVAGEMIDQLVVNEKQIYDQTILEKIEDFLIGVQNNFANTFTLYQVAVLCMFLYNYIDVNKSISAEVEL